MGEEIVNTQPQVNGKWSSREFWISASVIIVVQLAASLALWGVGGMKLTAPQWIDLIKWITPLMAGIFCGSKAIQKVSLALINKQVVDDDHADWTSREFWVAAGSLLLTLTFSLIFFIQGRITTDEWIDLMKWLIPMQAGIFSAATTTHKAIAAWGARTGSAQLPPIQLPLVQPESTPVKTDNVG